MLNIKEEGEFVDEVIARQSFKSFGNRSEKELALKALGIETIEDLLCYYPFRYEDMATKEVSELADGQKAVIQGVVATARSSFVSAGPKIV